MGEDDQGQDTELGRDVEPVAIPRERAIDQKPVPFWGDELAAALASGGTVYIALPGMCRALGTWTSLSMLAGRARALQAQGGGRAYVASGTRLGRRRTDVRMTRTPPPVTKGAFCCYLASASTRLWASLVVRGKVSALRDALLARASDRPHRLRRR
jgi:hypothetical protein